MRVKLWICIANLHIAFFTAKWKCLFFEICVTQWDDLPKLYMSESFVVEQCVSCFREETSRCFMKNEPSFCGKWHVVLWKVTRRFWKTTRCFVGSRKRMRRHRKEVRWWGGCWRIYRRREGLKNTCLEIWNERCENLLVRAYIHTYTGVFVFLLSQVSQWFT